MNTTNNNNNNVTNSVKVTFNGELRRLPYRAEPFPDFLARLTTLFATDCLTLSYIDEDGDSVAIGNDEEFQLALSECATSVLRLIASVPSAACETLTRECGSVESSDTPSVTVATNTNAHYESAPSVPAQTAQSIDDLKAHIRALRQGGPVRALSASKREELRDLRQKLAAAKRERRVNATNATRMNRDVSATQNDSPARTESKSNDDATPTDSVNVSDATPTESTESLNLTDAVDEVTNVDPDPVALESVRAIRLNFRHKLGELRSQFPEGKFSDEQRTRFREAKNLLVADRNAALAAFKDSELKSENPVEVIKRTFREKLANLKQEYADSDGKFARRLLSQDDGFAFTQKRAALVSERNLSLRDLRLARQVREKSLSATSANNDSNPWQPKWKRRRFNRRCFDNEKSEEWKIQKTARKIANLERKLAYFRQVRAEQLENQARGSTVAPPPPTSDVVAMQTTARE